MDHEALAKQFELHRERLRAVAYRLLGAAGEAEDAVQEAWLRLSRAEDLAIENPGGWLTTVVARVCLDALRRRRARAEDLQGLSPPGPFDGASPEPSAEDEQLLAESVGLALLVVLATLTPPERLAFVLHDLFAVPFEEVAPIVGRSVDAAKQLASRARRRVRGARTVPEAELKRQRRTVEAFLEAARGGDLAALVTLLHPDVVVHADVMTVRGADKVGRQALVFSRGFTQYASLALVNGAVGLVVAPKGRLATVLAFDIRDGQIGEIRVFGDPSGFGNLELALLDPPGPRSDTA